jgi:hypothetical protein
MRERPAKGPNAAPDVLQEGVRLAPPVALLLKGDDPGLVRRMPERGTTGISTVSKDYIRLLSHCGKDGCFAPEKPHGTGEAACHSEFLNLAPVE